jgi:hypothetical protein
VSGVRLTLRLTRLSPTHHAFAYVREDGSGETVTLETKSLLTHDLLHFAMETEAGLKQSFYGKLAAGMSLADVAAEALAGEAAATERAVGAMTGALKSEAAADRVVAGFRALSNALGESAPGWFDEAFVQRVRERMRQLSGEWKATPFGGTMVLTFES